MIFVTFPNFLEIITHYLPWISLILKACWSVGDWIFATDHTIKYGKHLAAGAQQKSEHLENIGKKKLIKFVNLQIVLAGSI